MLDWDLRAPLESPCLFFCTGLFSFRLHSFDQVIAFENGDDEGYITEKIANAFLAGAVPVYWGTVDALSAFNPKSFIHCGEFTNLEACADRVAEVGMTCTYVLCSINSQIHFGCLVHVCRSVSVLATAMRTFSPKSFIDCREFADLEACADRVTEVGTYV